MSGSRELHRLAVLATLAVVLAACSSSLEPVATLETSAWVPGGSPIAGDLQNPRGVAVTPDGAVLVAEAGVGGDGPCFPGPEGGDVCIGTTGGVTRIDRAGQRRVLDGLPSFADAGGVFAIGAHDVSVLGNGNLYVSTGLGADPADRDAMFPDGSGGGFGFLWRGSQARGTVAAVADLADFERADPDGAGPDSNPYGVLALPGAQIVADAGGNSLLRVTQTGAVELLAVFPETMVLAPPFLGLPPGAEIPMQAVPTSVAQGPDGALYVGTLTGFPFPVGGATVFRVVPGEAPEPFATGFTNIIDVGFDAHGDLYVLELATNGLLSGDLSGALKRFHEGAIETMLDASDGLVAPGGFAFGTRGELYVSVGSVFPTGDLLRFDPKPAPSHAGRRTRRPAQRSSVPIPGHGRAATPGPRGRLAKGSAVAILAPVPRRAATASRAGRAPSRARAAPDRHRTRGTWRARGAPSARATFARRAR